MNKSKKNISTLHKSFEKLSKVALIKIEQQQVTDVVKILNEFEEIFTLYLDRKKNKRSKFIEVFIGVCPPESLEITLQKIESDFLQLYIDTFLQIWKAAYIKSSYNISRTAISILNNSFKKYRNDCLQVENRDNLKSVYKCNQSFLEFFNYVVSETSLKEDFQRIADFLFEYLFWITELPEEQLESYLKLLMNPMHSESSEKSEITVNTALLNEPASVGIQAFLDLYFNIWKNAFDNKHDNVAYNTVTVIENILTTFLSQGRRSRNYLTIANYFIRLLQNINLEISKSPNKFSATSAKASFIWFFNIVFKKDFDINLINDLQVSLFISLKHTLVDKNKKQFLAFVDHIISGMYHPEFAFLPDFDYSAKSVDRVLSREYDDAKHKLVTASSNILTIQDYQKAKIVFDELKAVIEKFQNIEDSEKQRVINGYFEYINKELKYSIVQQTVVWLGAYCLFLKQYDFIDELLYFNQPKDSHVSWGNQDINPLNIHDIFNLYHRRYELEHNFTFLWDGHHESSTYYNTFIAILLMNAINQNQRKGQTWRNEYSPNFKDLVKSPQELEGIAHSFDDLKRITESLKISDVILKGCGLNEKIANTVIDLLENICARIEIEKKEIIVSAAIDPVKAQYFIDNVFEYYQKGGAIKNIINYYCPIASENEPYPGKQFLSFGINEITMKSYFAKNDEGDYFGWPDSFARRFTFDENINLTSIFIKKCLKSEDKINQSMIVSEIDKINPLDDKVLIFSNLYPSYEIFGSNTGFIPVEEIPEKERPAIREFVGKYKGADIFVYYDETKWKQLLILKKHPVKGIGTIKYYVPTDENEFNIKEHFYWKILDLNLETDIINKIIKDQPYWLLQHASEKEAQERFLQTQVDVIIRYKMNLELPEDFQGWFFNM